ncbi:putative vacuolar membrane protein-2 [Elsinoe australis]|uniref:Putative vacuolar membrane protein-2 n=1 Tax=Elsinoe australis TaxID=40998 RepID=A0A4U7AMB7_9PEZI|nr:putative vacuolar membrane protein-2 [Elsinoe australis]
MTREIPSSMTAALDAPDNSQDERRISDFETAPLEPVRSKTQMSERMRRTVGLVLLFFTVILWTASNFLASTLFADNTYSKPFLVTYVNTSFFVIPLIPIFLRQLFTDPQSITTFLTNLRRSLTYRQLSQTDSHASAPLQSPPPTPALRAPSIRSLLTSPNSGLTLRETAHLSLEFCLLWYLANYFVAACLEYTTVASSTILTSTSSVFTLLFGTLFRVETFTLRKLAGVLASLAGIVLISSVDLSGSSDKNRGSFPHKSIRELGVGDGMALLSAVLYGLYAVFMKKRIGDESRVHMPLFFGLVGLFNVLLLWPGFIVLHFTGIETFELPPSGRVSMIIAVNSVSSLVSDFAWAYAVLLTSPIVVTVGLSTTIPLSLIGQVVLNGQTSSWVYWVGALVVVLSFVIVNNGEGVEETHGVVKSQEEGEEEQGLMAGREGGEGDGQVRVDR